MLTNDTDSLISQAKTLRLLPPNTFLETDQEEDERLLNELLAMDPDADPIQWLMDSHSELCAKLLLWQLLDSLRSNLIGLRRTITETTPDVINELEEKIGCRFNRQDLALLRPLAYTHPLAVDEERLLHIFARLNPKRAAASNAGGKIGNWSNLRNRLLSLPDNANPLVWLRENHLQYAATSTLQYLISQVTPKHTDMLKHDIVGAADFLPKPSCRSNNIKITLNVVFPLFDVYLIGLSFRIFNHQLKTRPLEPPAPVRWTGRGTLSDDAGNHYLICAYTLTYSTSYAWVDYELRLLCFPSIAKSAKRLYLSFEQARLTAAKKARDGERYYEVPLEKLSWTLDIHSLRQHYPGFFS